MNLPFALAALVVIPLAQIPLVAYLGRSAELGPDETPATPGEGYVTYGTESARPDARDGERRCPHCGSPTDDYDYCGQCAGRLPAAPRWGR
jgi:hypothetical protein